MKPVIFLNSHPIQYFGPLYQQIQATSTLSISVLYCSDESVVGKSDKDFGQAVKWDIPLLDGYKHTFIKNYSLKPSIHAGFWGLFNPGIIVELYKQPASILIVHGWAYSTHIMAIVFGKLFGHTVCLRAETPFNQEAKKNKFKTSIKNNLLRILFLCIHRFLFIGRQNKMFYENLGVDKNKLVFTPYAVDNDRFRKIFLTTEKTKARLNLNLPANKKIILFSGKYISKKRPLDLLNAFKQLNDPNTFLIFVGDGELREDMETYLMENGLMENVLLTGFINQAEMPLYYKSADIFVMCSGAGETWGLSVNEAMNFGLPVIVSDMSGCAYDLVEGNGAVFETGNIPQLVSSLKKYVQLSGEEQSVLEKISLQKIDQYSYKQVIAAIESLSV